MEQWQDTNIPDLYLVYFARLFEFLALDLRSQGDLGPTVEKVDVLAVPQVYREMRLPIDPARVVREVVLWVSRDRAALPQPNSVSTQYWSDPVRGFIQTDFWQFGRGLISTRWGPEFLSQCDAVLEELRQDDEGGRDLSRLLELELRGEINVFQTLWQAKNSS